MVLDIKKTRLKKTEGNYIAQISSCVQRGVNSHRYSYVRLLNNPSRKQGDFIKEYAVPKTETMSKGAD